MVCADNGMGQYKLPSWSKVGMEITTEDLNKVFLARENESSAFSLESGWAFALFFLGLVSVITVVIYLRISQKKQKQDNNTANKERLSEEIGLQEKILVRMGKVEERIQVLEDVTQRLCLKKPRSGKMGDQKDSD